MFGSAWKAAPFLNGKIAAVKLLTQNLDLSINYLQKANFELAGGNEAKAYFKKDEASGYTFVLEEDDRSGLEP
jgi:hypothetical protein